jgi:predicted dehydrogenase
MPESTSDRPLRVALAGFGLAGAVLHAPLIAATPGLEIAAAVTRDPARRAKLAADHPQARAVDALEEVVGDVDVVVVVAPNRFHVPLAETALDAGCHVVVDKPIAVDGAQARAVAARAQDAGRLLVPFHNRRWDDDFLTLRRVAFAGALGRVLRLESRFDRWRPEPRQDTWREHGDPADGGGLLLDLGTHVADQAVQLLGPVTSVYAELDMRRPGVAVEDDVFLALEHAGGARSHLSASVVTAHIAPRFRALGDRAAFVSEGLDPQEGMLRDGATPLDEGFGRRPPERAMRRPGVAVEDDVFLALEHAGGARDAVAVADLLDAARRSAATGSAVAVG